MSAVNYEMELKRVRKELSEKRVEAEEMGHRVNVERVEKETKENELTERRAALEEEIIELEKRNRELLFREKQNLKQINQSEINVINATHQSET